MIIIIIIFIIIIIIIIIIIMMASRVFYTASDNGIKIQVGARYSSVVRAFRSWCDRSSNRSFIVDPLSYFSFQPVLHNWCNKGRGMCYPVYLDDAYKITLAANRKE